MQKKLTQINNWKVNIIEKNIIEGWTRIYFSAAFCKYLYWQQTFLHFIKYFL